MVGAVIGAVLHATTAFMMPFFVVDIAASVYTLLYAPLPNKLVPGTFYWRLRTLSFS